jgi:subtilisin family serine protease
MQARLLFSAILLCFCSVTSFAGDGKWFSHGPDGKNQFTQANDRILIRFQEGMSFAQKAAILSGERAISKLTADDVLPSPDVTIANVSGLSSDQLNALLSRLNENEQVVYANPFLIYSDGTYQGIQDRIIVRLKSSKDVGKMNGIAKDQRLNLLERNEFDPLMFVLQTTKASKGNAVQVANALHESNVFDYAEPDFLLLLKRFNTNDGLLGYQWSLKNTGSSIQYNGTPGADMNVFNAWGVTSGVSNIKVAIIDEGVDLNHPDLIANLLGGYDATGLGSGGGPLGNDAHGTACAGIVAGVGNNSIGVAGVAYGCKIIPVRIAYSNAQGNWVTSNTWIGNALNWAWQTGGADVLSNSWGGGSSSTTINNAITAAVTSGRGGLGAPVLFAAGNDNGANSYPATQTNTISVIAMSMCYQRKNLTSCDGENFWGSNYGAGADVAAPGVKITTTDISGAAGYVAGDYTGTFNGTSSATPNAAGVMALILSANAGLTATQARFALESTCRKVGSYTYSAGVSDQPNGTWSNDLGYGLVDAYTAILSVTPQVTNDAGISSISSPNGTICATSASPQVSLNNYGSNALNSVVINYRVDAGTVLTYNWNGTLASGSSTLVTLPSVSFAGGSHTFTVWTSLPNGNSDNGPSNNQRTSNFTSASNTVTLTIVFDNYPEETSWQILSGTTVLAAGGTYGSQPDGSTLITNICLPDGCFNFVISDAYADGMCCSYGNGSYVLKNASGVTLASGGTYTTSQTTNFCVTSSNPLVASIASSTNVSCNGGNNGSANASATGGTSPYSYSWSNGATGSSVTGLVAGTYTVTVTDANSGQATANVTISQPSVLVASGSSSNVSCFGASNGSASVSVSGGTSPYSYSWSNGGTGSSISGLTVGAYSVVVTDSKGCTANASATITQPPVLTSSASATNASCFGAANGSVTLSVSGGTGAYSYSWSNGSTAQNLVAVVAGNYSVTVTDANGCTSASSATVGQPSAIVLSSSVVAATCGSATNGSVDLSVSGGNPPYSYAWSNGSTTQDLSSVASGTYSVTVTDASGCSAGTYATIGENSTLASSASASAVSCNGGSNGFASVTVSGGTAPYSYNWSNGGTASSISGISAGNYSVTVTDASGCTSGSSTTVGQPSALSVNVTGSDASCGTTDGSASATAAGGTAPYSYSWSNGSTSASVAGLAAATYTVTVTDANGCVANGSVIIAEDCSACTYQAINSNNFEGGLGIWVDGGTDCSRISSAAYANSGTYSVQLRDNTSTSVTSTGNMDLTDYDEVTVSLSFMTNGLSSGEDFWLQLSSDGGITYTTVKAWVMSTDFVNNQRQNVQVVLAGTFTSNSRLRFRCDASDDIDVVHIDDVVVSGCRQPLNCTYQSVNTNNYESSLGVWTDGGTDCARISNATYASSGTFSVQLRDNTSTSVMSTGNLDLSPYQELTVSLSYVTAGFSSGEDFWLQVSNDGGTTYATVKAWVMNTDFANGQRNNPVVVIQGPFASNSRIRFRCDASTDADVVYIDDVTITGCQGAAARLINPENEGIVSESDGAIVSGLNIFPNPTSNELNVQYELSERANLELRVMDMTGKLVYQVNSSNDEGMNITLLSTNELASGMYFITLIANEQVVTKRFAVQR